MNPGFRKKLSKVHFFSRNNLLLLSKLHSFLSSILFRKCFIFLCSLMNVALGNIHIPYLSLFRDTSLSLSLSWCSFLCLGSSFKREYEQRVVSHEHLAVCEFYGFGLPPLVYVILFCYRMMILFIVPSYNNLFYNYSIHITLRNSLFYFIFSVSPFV